MKSFLLERLKDFTLSNEIVRMIRRLGEYKGKQELFKKQAPEVLENLRQVALVQSTESSNRLENITVDPQRLRDLVAEKTTPQNRSEAEIAGYRDVLNTIHMSAEHIPFSENVVLQFHRDMMKYTGIPGGIWKNSANEIVEYLPDGSKRIRFRPVEPFLVKEYMATLHRRYDEEINRQVVDPLVLMPLYVLDFLCIHPFSDGNGRTSRLLTLLLLYHQGYEVGRYISIERIIERTKESYYEVLEKCSNGWHDGRHAVIPWIEYYYSILLAAYDEFEQRANILVSGRGSKTGMVKNAIAGFVSDFTVSDIQQACPLVSIDMIRHILKQLKADGQIEIISRGQHARWRKCVN